MAREDASVDREALAALVEALPKVELHLHVEGTLQPEMLFEMARRNGIALRFASIEELRSAYAFKDLQSFLDLHYEAMGVLRTEQDYFDLTFDYLQRAAAQGLVHTELFFDPQGHTSRGVAFDTVIEGIGKALEAGHKRLGVSSRLILSFWRHLSEAQAFEAWEQAQPYLDRIAAVGLDSAEAGNPPEKFERVFAQARRQGLKAVAHAGEEGPPSYIWGALEALRVNRIDHGVRCVEDEALVRHLEHERVPLTVCPLSNVRLRVVPDMASHPLLGMLARGLCVTVNSDDPAYFGGYVGDNYRAVLDALQPSAKQLLALAANAIDASFLAPPEKASLHERLQQGAERCGFAQDLPSRLSSTGDNP